jgi:hypothetical protein
MPIKLGGLCVYMKRGGDLGWWYIDIVFFFYSPFRYHDL